MTGLFELGILLVVPTLATLASFIYRYYCDDIIYLEHTEARARVHGWGVYGAPSAPGAPGKADKKRPKSALLQSAHVKDCKHECFGYFCGVRHG